VRVSTARFPSEQLLNVRQVERALSFEESPRFAARVVRQHALAQAHRVCGLRAWRDQRQPPCMSDGGFRPCSSARSARSLPMESFLALISTMSKTIAGRDAVASGEWK
jgi:hypothetical protein